MKKYKHLYLTGLMGSGKTTVGELAARKLSRKFVDLDKLIEHGTKTSINEIFERYGEETFRNIETKVLENLPMEEKLVIATGGGTILRKKNRELMKEKGAIIWIDVPIEQLARRLEGDSQRPLLKGEKTIQETLEEIMANREEFYKDCTIHLDAESLTPLQVVLEISKELKK